MTRRSKKGNYTESDRRLILQAAISESAGGTITEKQTWLMNMGVHRPGYPNEPVTESAIKYWQNAHRKVKVLTMNQYEQAIDKLISSPPSYRALRDQLPQLISGSDFVDV